MSAPVLAEFVEEGDDAHAPSWLALRELEAFDYTAQFEDRRVARRMPNGIMDHGVTGEPGEGRLVTFRAFLGPGYFDELERIARSGAERVVFWFSI